MKSDFKQWGKGIVKSFDLNSQNEFPKAKVFKKIFGT